MSTYFHATVMIMLDNNKEHKQELYHVKLPENLNMTDTVTIEKLVRESFLERMQPMIKNCGTEKLKDDVRKSIMEAKLLNIEHEDPKKVPLFV